MKSKRLLALIVALSTLISCTCVWGGTTASANTEPETLLAYWDGVIYKNDYATVVSKPITYYNSTYSSYAQSGTTKQQYLYQASAYNSALLSVGFAQGMAGYKVDTTATDVKIGTIASTTYDIDGKTGSYYDVTYAALQNNVDSNVSSYVTATTPVLSEGFEFCIPSGSESASRVWKFQLRDGDLTDSYNLTWEFTYKNGQITLSYSANSSAKNSFNDSLKWYNTPSIESNKWYKFEIRASFLEDGRMNIGAFIDGKQFMYACENENYSIFSGNIAIYRNVFTTNSNLNLPAASHVHTYYDEITFKTMSSSYAPSASEPVDDTMLWVHFDTENATEMPVGTSESSKLYAVDDEEENNPDRKLAVSTSSSATYVGATETFVPDADYGSNVMKITAESYNSEIHSIDYHRLITTFRSFFTEHNKLDDVVVAELAYDIKIPEGDAGTMRQCWLNYAKCDAEGTSVKRVEVKIENGKIYGAKSKGLADYNTDVEGTEIKLTKVPFSYGEWHKIRVLSYYTYNATDGTYNVVSKVLCDNDIIYQNEFVLSKHDGYEGNFGFADIDWKFHSTSNTAPVTYLGDITVKTYSNGTYDDSEFGLWVDPNRIEISATSGTGNISGSVKIYGNEDITGARLIVALFDGYDRLQSLVSSDVITDADGCRTMSCDLLSASAIPSGYKYKVFLFDSLTSVKPLAEQVTGTIE